jgi:molecular chaperone HscB
VSTVSARDPFTVFGVERTLDLDERALERRYLALSRESHPDRLRSQEVGDCPAALARSAEVNDAWRVLRDPWLRARALLETRSPGVLAKNQKLDPAFLAEALELAEEVAFATGPKVAPLRTRLTAAIAADFDALRAELARGDVDAAAKRFHASHYHRKALHDLEQKA